MWPGSPCPSGARLIANPSSVGVLVLHITLHNADGLADRLALVLLEGCAADHERRSQYQSLTWITGSEAREKLKAVVDGLLDLVLGVWLPVCDLWWVDGPPEIDPHHLSVEHAGCVAWIASGPRGCPFPDPSIDFSCGVKRSVVDNGVDVVLNVVANLVPEIGDLGHVEEETIEDA